MSQNKKQRLKDELTNHFNEEKAQVLKKVFVEASKAADGDAFARTKLPDEQESLNRLSDLMQDVGADVEFQNDMDIISFVNNPSTNYEDLNRAIQEIYSPFDY